MVNYASIDWMFGALADFRQNVTEPMSYLKAVTEAVGNELRIGGAADSADKGNGNHNAFTPAGSTTADGSRSSSPQQNRPRQG